MNSWKEKWSEDGLQLARLGLGFLYWSAASLVREVTEFELVLLNSVAVVANCFQKDPPLRGKKHYGENSLLQHCYATEKPPSSNTAMHQRNHAPPTLQNHHKIQKKHCKPTTNPRPNPKKPWKKTLCSTHAAIWKRRAGKTFAQSYGIWRCALVKHLQ